MILGGIVLLLGIGWCFYCYKSKAKQKQKYGDEKPVRVNSVPPDSPVDVSVIKNDFGSISTPLPSNANGRGNTSPMSVRSDDNLLNDADEDELYDRMEPETGGKGTNETLGGVAQAGGEGNAATDRLVSDDLEEEGSEDSMYENENVINDNVTEGGRNSHIHDLERVTSLSGESGADHNVHGVRFSGVSERISQSAAGGNDNGNGKRYSTRSSKTASQRTHAMSDIGSDGDIVSEDLNEYVDTAGNINGDNINDPNNNPFGAGNDVALQLESYDPNNLPYRASRAEGMDSNAKSSSKANENDVGGGTVAGDIDENDAALNAIATNVGLAFDVQRNAKDSIDEVFDAAPPSANDNSKGNNDLTTVTEDDTPQTDNVIGNKEDGDGDNQ